MELTNSCCQGDVCAGKLDKCFHISPVHGVVMPSVSPHELLLAEYLTAAELMQSSFFYMSLCSGKGLDAEKTNPSFEVAVIYISNTTLYVFIIAPITKNLILGTPKIWRTGGVCSGVWSHGADPGGSTLQPPAPLAPDLV